jgi:hypothetical protein
MNGILRAVILSFFRNMSTKTKILLGSTVAVFIILLGVWVFRPRGMSSETILPQGIAALSPLSITDANGLTWTLDPVRGQSLSPINESGKKPGLPLVLKTNTIKINERTISIGLTLEGQAGEKYMAGALKNGTRQPQPIFRILDENGKALAAGRFEYG